MKEVKDLDKDLKDLDKDLMRSAVGPYAQKESRDKLLQKESRDKLLQKEKKETQIKELFIDIFDINKVLAKKIFNDSTRYPNKEKVERILKEIISKLEQRNIGYFNSKERNDDIEKLNGLLQQVKNTEIKNKKDFNTILNELKDTFKK